MTKRYKRQKDVVMPKKLIIYQKEGTTSSSNMYVNVNVCAICQETKPCIVSEECEAYEHYSEIGVCLECVIKYLQEFHKLPEPDKIP